MPPSMQRESIPITVNTNSFVITQLPAMNYNQYTIEFLPEVKRPEKRIRLFHTLQTSVAPQIFAVRAVYDGKGLAYCPALLALPNGNSGTFDLNFNIRSGPNPETSGRVSQLVKITKTIGGCVKPSKDVEDMTRKRGNTEKAIVATNLLQLIVRQRPNMDCKNARAYFPGEERFPIGNGHIEIWRGFFQSVRPSVDKMILTIDTCIAAIYTSGPLDNLCAKFAGVNNIRDLNYKSDDQRFRELDKFLHEVLITYKMGDGKGRESKTKTIYELVPNAGGYTFTDDQNEPITVQEHFKSAYNIHLMYPFIIGVCLSPKNSDKVVIVPLELCTVLPGQFYRKKLADELTPQLLKFATLKPEEKMKRINEAVKRYNESEFVVESKMIVDITPVKARGKLLNAPLLTYGQNIQISPRIGAWNVVSKTLHTPKPLKSWAVLNFCPDKLSNPQCHEYIIQLMGCCRKLGMDPSAPDVISPGQGAAVEKSLDAAMQTAYQLNKIAPRILLVILPWSAPAIKRKVKYWGDITHGVLTQCIRIDKFYGKQKNDQYWNNVALKLNARLRGQNWHVNDSPIMKELALERFMIIGADVSHPAATMYHPSTTSLVYSLDACATSYAAITRLQPPRVECIFNLKEMVKEALQQFHKRWGRLPIRLFFFRDGISEGELEGVGNVEIGDIKEAIKELGGEGIIRLTFIVVTKRHHAVLFPTSDKTSDNKGNCLPGTVVHKDITHPIMHDFYLQSHGSIQGTSRSSHYIVLADENINFDMDRIQKLSYALCHVYAKATRAVSIPAPIYYADLVCSRGMIHLNPNANLSFSDPDDASSTSSEKGKEKKKKRKWSDFDLQPWLDAFKDVNGGIKSQMYFL